MFYIHILERFLDLDLAVVNGQMSETQMSVYHEAQARIDKKVIFSKGKFEMNLRSGSEVGISDRLFDHFKTCMDAQNRNLAEAQSDGLIPVEVSPNVVRFIDPNAPILLGMTKGGGVEIPEGGTTNVDFFWSGCDIYISNEMLKGISDGADLASIIATFSAALPAATPVAAITAAASALASVGLGRLASDYPNGIIIDCDLSPGTQHTGLIRPQVPGSMVDM